MTTMTFHITGRLKEYFSPDPSDPSDPSGSRHSIALVDAQCSWPNFPSSIFQRVVIRYQCCPRLGSSIEDLDAAVFEGMEETVFELECKSDLPMIGNHSPTVDALAIKIVRPDPIPPT